MIIMNTDQNICNIQIGFLNYYMSNIQIGLRVTMLV